MHRINQKKQSDPSTKKYADIAYNVKLIEMRYFQEHFSEEDFRRFDRLRHLRKSGDRMLCRSHCNCSHNRSTYYVQQNPTFP